MDLVQQAVKSVQPNHIPQEKPERAVIFTIADKGNIDYAIKLKNSVQKFHPDVDFKIYGQGKLDKIKDPQKFYKATPLFARELIKEYDVVIKMDADSILLGDISHVINDRTYDVGTVLNNNSVTPHITIQGIPANYYVNCGFVAMRSKEFVDTWWDKCNSFMFGHFQYREQDILNILAYFGPWQHKNFDSTTPFWHGLIANGHRMQFDLDQDNSVFVDIPLGGDTVMRKFIKVYHAAGGNVVYKQGQKLNFKLYFSEKVAEYMEQLSKDDNK